MRKITLLLFVLCGCATGISLGALQPMLTELLTKGQTTVSILVTSTDAGIRLDLVKRPDMDAGQSADSGPIAQVDSGQSPQSDSGQSADSGKDSGQPSQPDGGVKRPSTSKGVGFYVVGAKLYDANGAEFRVRGTNKTHQDFWAQGLSKTKSNTTRWLIYFADDPQRSVRDMTSAQIGGSTADKAVAIPGYWDGTCKSDQASFNTMVNRWVRDASVYQQIERFSMLNIANEWGNSETAWRDMYVMAIPRIRAAGWHGTIVVDAPGCGQNATAIVNQGRNILNADPERNVLFDWHIYGLVFDSQGGVPRQYAEQIDLVPTMDALYNSELAVIIGEFGPGRNIGPSPTLMTPQRIVSVAESHGFGWLSWSWDDNDQAGGRCSNTSFCHAYDPNVYKNSDSDLTDFGKVMVGLWNQLAKPASVFP